MKRIYILSLLFLILVNCAPAGYRFSMLKPDNPQQQNIIKYDYLLKNSQSFDFSDDNVDITIVIEKNTLFAGVEKGALQYWRYPSIHLTIRNKINNRITLDINKIKFRRWQGFTRPVVWIEGKYENKAVLIEDDKQKRVTLTNKIIDIEPQRGDSLVFSDDPSWRYSRTYSLFPSPREHSRIDFGLYIPLQIGSKTIDYNFEFQAIAE